MKKTFALLLALAMLLSLSACGSSPKASSTAAAPEEAAYESDYAYDSFVAEEPMEAEMGGFSMNSAGSGSTAPEVDPDKIIYSADVNIETTDFDETLTALDALIREVGGWVESSSVSGSNYYNTSRGRASARSASYTLRIPSDKFAGLMNSLSTLGNVPYSHTYTENVTAQYYDVQARLTAYRTQETRLLEMMEVAQTVEDIILLEDRLTELRYEIESLQSTLNNWDRRVSYSTVSLNIDEVQEYTPETVVQPSYGQQLLSALKNGMHGVASFFKGLLVALAAALPALLVLGVFGLIVYAIVMAALRAKNRKAARRQAAAQKTEAPAEDAGKEE